MLWCQVLRACGGAAHVAAHRRVVGPARSIILALVAESVLAVVVIVGFFAPAEQEVSSRARGTNGDDQREGQAALLLFLGFDFKLLDLIFGALHLGVKGGLAHLSDLVVVPF